MLKPFRPSLVILYFSKTLLKALVIDILIFSDLQKLPIIYIIHIILLFRQVTAKLRGYITLKPTVLLKCNITLTRIFFLSKLLSSIESRAFSA